MKRTAYGINKRTMAMFAVAGSIIACGGVLMPVSAYADVRQDDVIVGQTVEERQLDQNQAPDISAPIALLVDEDGRTYFSRGADQPVKIASTTKIMTAILTLEHMSLDDSVMVMDEDLKDLPSDGSSAGLKVGDKLTVGDALLGLMIPSGNDAAMVIARACGQAMIDDGTYDGSQSAYDTFITAMNDKAKEIGCEDTVFTNPNGLDVDKFAGDLHSTASDLAKMAQYAMRNEDFRRIVSTGDTTIPVENSDRKDDEKQLELKSTDLLLDTFDGMLGIKTGSTVEAGNCFVGACERNGKEYYTVVLDAEDRTAVFADTRELFDWITMHNRVYDLKTDGAAEESTGDDADQRGDDHADEHGSRHLADDQQQRDQAAPEHCAEDQRQECAQGPSKENEQQGQQQSGAAEHRIHTHRQKDIVKACIDPGQLDLHEDRQNGQCQRNDGNPRPHDPGGEKRHIDIGPAAGSSGNRFRNGMERFTAGHKQHKPG